MALIELTKVNKFFTMGHEVLHVLKDITLNIEEGEFCAIVGSSGSGKTTLMNILGLLDQPSSGQYSIDNNSSSSLNDKQLSHMRNKMIGLVFQSFNLLPKSNALKNVAMPLLYATAYNSQLNDVTIDQMAEKALNRVGLSDRMLHKPNELSGGQRQRVAIARALVNSPKLLLADEPTGSLDSKTGKEILQLFQQLNREGVTVVLITHDPSIALQAQRRLRMEDGRLSEEK